jgi:ABC-type nitrate/sulfonate/bicarbonate transport system substrate-binding protein
MSAFTRRHRGTAWTRLRLAGIAGLAGLVAASGCTLAGGSESTEPSGAVKIGFLYDAHAANVWTIDQCSDTSTRFQLLNFKQFAEVQRAFESGQIDIAAMGYQNSAQMIGNGFTEFKGVAGVYTGAEHITVKKGSNIRAWTDLAGKRVGIPPNSFVEMLFRAGAKENGLDMDSIEVVPFPGAGPPMLSALQKGDIDAMVAWEPNSARAAVEGYGEYPPFNIQQGRIGKATSLAYASNKIIGARRAAVETFVKCLAERTEKLSADQATWTQELIKRTGLSRPVADQAIKTGTMDVKMYQASGQRIIQQFAAAGVVKDPGGAFAASLDYSFLEKATGRPRSGLGAGAGAG